MKLSTRTRYGIRALLELAENTGDSPLQIKVIGKKQDISIKYLEQLMSSLKGGGFVRSLCGSKGGYLLAKEAKDIKLIDVFNCLEGPFVTVECLADKSLCSRTSDCVTRKVWFKVQRAVNEVLESMSLQDLVEQAKEQRELNYQI